MSDSKSRRKHLAQYLYDVPKSGIREFFDIVATRKDIISLGIGEPDFATPWHIRQAAIQSLENGVTAYTSNWGTMELREAIADYVSRSFQVAYNPQDEILVTVGVSEGLDIALRAIIEPGDEVLYHEPSFVSYGPVVTFAGGKPVPVATRRENDFQLTRALLEPKVTRKSKALLINFPTNPTGAVLDRKNVEDIAAFVMEHDLVLLTDEIYAELTYEGERVSIASLPGMKERTIFLNGFSKAWAMTGFRLGFTCAPPDITDMMMKIHQYTMMCAPTLSQKAAVEALRNGDPDVEEMRSEYNRRRNYIHSALNEMGLPCHMPKGAFYAFPYVGHLGLSSKEFSLRLLNEVMVACVPGSAFGACGEGYLRCSYATDLEEIKEAMSRMGAFVKKLST